jgi:hypothetical protein
MSEKPESAEASTTNAAPKTRSTWLGVVLAILKFLRVPLLCVVALAVGLWIGYVKLGAQPASEMVHMSTWKHLLDLIFAN